MSCNLGFKAVSKPKEHIFLGCDWNDGNTVAPIAKLINEQYPIWYDEGSTEDTKWESAVAEQIKGCKMAIFFAGRDLLTRNESDMCREYALVKRLKKDSVCVWLDDMSEFDERTLPDNMYELWLGLINMPSVTVYDKVNVKDKAATVLSFINNPVTSIEQTEVGNQSKLRKFLKWLPTGLSAIITAIVVSVVVNIYRNITNKNAVIDENQNSIASEDNYERYRGKMYADKLMSADDIIINDIITMGKYEQDNDETNGMEEIEWRVLDKKDHNLLLISDKILCNRVFYGVNNQTTHVDSDYNTTVKLNATWENSDLRKWLNEDFINEYFTSSEQALINTTTIANAGLTVNFSEHFPDYDDTYIIEKQNDTEDKLFLLSAEECSTYFPSDEDRIAKHYVYHSDNSWWLRSPGYGLEISKRRSNERSGDEIYKYTLSANKMQTIAADGTWTNYEYDYSDYQYNFGTDVISQWDNDSSGVRPAMWIKIGD